MEGERQSPAAVSAAVSKVLDDDDLLIEILIRVGFPTTLVRAALVCKHWLGHVSDPKFLHRFCKLHPPSILGFYIVDESGPLLDTPRFITMLPQPPELADIVCRTNFSLNTSHTRIIDCCNGSILTARRKGFQLALGVHSMLCPERGMTIQTLPLRNAFQDGECNYSAILSKEEHGIVSYMYVSVGYNNKSTKSIMHIYMLHRADGTWHNHLTLATDMFVSLRQEPRAVLVDNKIYMARSLPERDIVVLDLVSSSFSTIQLPQGVEYGVLGTIVFSREAYSSGLFLVHAKDLQLRIWLHKGDNWLLVDNICLHEMCAKLKMSDCMIEDEHAAILWISKVGDNAEFMFLQMGRFILYLDIKCRTLHRVYERTKDGRCSYYELCPCKMIWPPTFPPLKDDPARNDM